MVLHYINLTQTDIITQCDIRYFLSQKSRNREGLFDRFALSYNGQPFELSIQGGKYFDCHPRSDEPKITDYQIVEVSVFRDGIFVNPDDVNLPLFPDDQVFSVSLDQLVDALIMFFETGGTISANG